MKAFTIPRVESDRALRKSCWFKLILSSLILPWLALSQSYAQAPAQGPTLAPEKSAEKVAEKAPPAGITDLKLGEFVPVPRIKVPVTELKHAKFPVIDVHSHFRVKMRHDPQQLEEFIALMDRQHIAVSVSLDGLLGPTLDEHIQFLWTKYRDRFAIFANIDWQGDGALDDYSSWACHRSDFAHRTVLALEEAQKRGVCGVKLFKLFGLGYRNPDGSLIAIDDPRFDPIWDACGRLHLPIIMHTADPSAFFDPITPENERYEELSRHPDWHFPSDRFPSRASLHAARNRLIARHPKTTFITAHLGNDGEDLEETSKLLEDHPNVYVEIASRISELGRQPYTAREFLIRYQDRILFGTDGPWPELRYQSYWRFLETRDQYFPYSEKPIPPQGLWRIYGVHLPDEVLMKIYETNVCSIVDGLRERLDKWKATH